MCMYVTNGDNIDCSFFVNTKRSFMSQLFVSGGSDEAVSVAKVATWASSRASSPKSAVMDLLARSGSELP